MSILLIMLLLLLSVVGPILGSFMIYRRMTNYFDSFAHSMILSSALSSIFHLNFQVSLFIFSLFFGFIMCILRFKNFKLTNMHLIIMSSLFIGLAILLNSVHEKMHEHTHQHTECCAHDDKNILSMLIGGHIDDLKYNALLWPLILLSTLLIISISFYRTWLKDIINDGLVPVELKYFWLDALFLIVLSLFAFISVQFNGALLSLSITILPVLSAVRLNKGPFKTIKIAIILNIIIALLAMIIIHFDKSRILPSFGIIELFMQFICFSFVFGYCYISEGYITIK